MNCQARNQHFITQKGIINYSTLNQKNESQPQGRPAAVGSALAADPTLYQFIIHYSLFIIHYSLFIIHYSLFIIHYSLFIIKTKLLTFLLITGLLMAGFKIAARKKRVIFLGDSITQAAVQPGGYISLLKDALQGYGQAEAYELIGAGISGNKVPDLQSRLEKYVLQQKPALVFIYIGVNDVWHFTHPSTGGKGTPKDLYEKGLNDLINRIQKAGAKVVLCTPAAIGEKHDGSNAQDAMLDEYSEISRKIARIHKFPMCDLRKAFMAYSKANNRSNQEKDVLTNVGVHLNAVSNAFVALQMMPFLLRGN